MEMLPRYRLSVGQELTYETISEFKGQYKGEPDGMSEGSTAVFDVVAGDPPSGWRIVGRSKSWLVRDGNRRDRDWELVAFDLKPDGAATMSRGVGWWEGVPEVFPALPADEAQIKGQWQRELPLEARIVYAPATDASGSFAFTGDVIDPLDRIHLHKRQLEFQFDPARGLLQSYTSKESRDWGFVGQGTGRAILKDLQVRPPQWMAQFSRECDAYLDAVLRNQEARRAASDDPAKQETLLKEQRRDFVYLSVAARREARSATTTPGAARIRRNRRSKSTCRRGRRKCASSNSHLRRELYREPA